MTAINNSIFGVHSITPYSLSTGLPLSKEPFRVIGAFSVKLTQEIVQLGGGSSFDSWDMELGARTFEGSLTLRQYPSSLINLATGATVSENAAEPLGSISALRNAKGTSAFNATSGLASVSLKVGATADVPFASYVVVAASPTTVDVYVTSDLDFAQGTNKAFVGGSQKINATPLTITDGGDTDIPNFGLKLTGGSAVAFTVGDTAVFASRPSNTSSRSVNIGDPLSRSINIGLMAEAQRKSDGSMCSINIYNALMVGLPINLTEKAFSEAELTFQAKKSVDILTGNEGLFSLEQVISANL